jgi:hypothetical protein
MKTRFDENPLHRLFAQHHDTQYNNKNETLTKMALTITM